MATVKQAQPKDLNLDDAPAKQCDVFLVDGNGLAYRAFYALPEELQTVDGFPTNALLGMANMLMKLLADYRPATVLVAWDEKPTARIELDAEYKAHRRPMPDLLRQQVPYFEPIVEAFGYRNFRVAGQGGRRRHRHARGEGRGGRPQGLRRLDRPRRLPARLRATSAS